MDQESLRQTVVDLKDKLREHENEAVRIRQLLDGLSGFIPTVPRKYKKRRKTRQTEVKKTEMHPDTLKPKKPAPVPISQRNCPYLFGSDPCLNKATRKGGICQTHILRVHAGTPINGPRQRPTPSKKWGVPFKHPSQPDGYVTGEELVKRMKAGDAVPLTNPMC